MDSLDPEREPSSSSGLTPSPRAVFRRELANSAAAIGATAVVLGLADVMVSSIFFAALIGGPIGLLFGIAVLAGGTVVVISALTKALTGIRTIAGPIVVTMLAVVAGATGVITGNLTPFPAEPATPLAHAIICVGSAVTLGFFIGPRWVHLVGGIAGTGVVLWMLALGAADAQNTAHSPVGTLPTGQYSVGETTLPPPAEPAGAAHPSISSA